MSPMLLVPISNQSAYKRPASTRHRRLRSGHPAQDNSPKVAMEGSEPPLSAQGHAFAHTPDRALNFFGSYLADVGEQSVGAVSSLFDGSRDINARIERAGRAGYTIRLNGGLVDGLR